MKPFRLGKAFHFLPELQYLLPARSFRPQTFLLPCRACIRLRPQNEVPLGLPETGAGKSLFSPQVPGEPLDIVCNAINRTLPIQGKVPFSLHRQEGEN